MTASRYFIIDFDSTLVKTESLQELAAISLKGNLKRTEILQKIKDITEKAMTGKMPIDEALDARIKLLSANKKHLGMLIKVLKRNITPSFRRNKKFFAQNRKNIFIISSGFREVITPVVKILGVAEKNIFANTFVFDGSGNITGFDRSNVLAQEHGKLKQLQQLGLRGSVFVIGDGYTDMEMKAAATKFFAFTENVKRGEVVQGADYAVNSFDEFLYINKMPMAVSYPKSRIRILLLENVHPSAIALLKEEGYSVETLGRSLGEPELAARIGGISVLGIRSKTQVSKKILANAKKLVALGAFCVGTNQIDLDACSEKGIAVFNAPYSNTRSVVELALGEIIMLSRRVFEKSSKLHGGVWDKSAERSYEIRGKKLGIVGYGNIGSQLSAAAEALGMEVYYYDIAEKLAIGNARKCSTLTELLKKCDIVTLHVDGRPENKNIIGEKEFSLMKSNVIFLNMSRGYVVDVAALAKHVKSGKISGAAVDVFPEEPQGPSDSFETELRGLPNVILTPHIGGSTEEAQSSIGDFVAGKLRDFINTGNTSFSVNFPNIQLPALRNAHRMIHIHRNVPGVLSNINAVFAKNRINILGQYLNTNEKIGYVITDVAKEYDSAVIEQLKKVPETIKFRVLY